MEMTDSQFKGFVRFVLDDIKEVLENMPDGKKNYKRSLTTCSKRWKIK